MPTYRQSRGRQDHYRSPIGIPEADKLLLCVPSQPARLFSSPPRPPSFAWVSRSARFKVRLADLRDLCFSFHPPFYQVTRNKTRACPATVLHRCLNKSCCLFLICARGRKGFHGSSSLQTGAETQGLLCWHFYENHLLCLLFSYKNVDRMRRTIYSRN